MDIQELYRCGIIQTGYFVDDRRDIMPVKFQFELLPSYPHLLRDLAELIIEKLTDQVIDRIIASEDTVAVSTLASSMRNTPLVYQKGLEFVGAYDVGHPACLIVNQVNRQTLDDIISRAEKVGLRTTFILSIVGKPQQFSGINVLPVLPEELLLAAIRTTSPQQLVAVEAYLKTKN